ncbi:MAG TPA: hypothetical protein VEQ60_13795 [Longimicrobium sp.]|nr:hypothetical protein [Longimicrobium sp.]
MIGSIHRLLFPTLAAIILCTSPGAAQQDTVPQAPRRGGVEMIGGVRVGWPQKLSAYVGLGIPQKRFPEGYTGWSVTVEPGLGGGMVGIGHTTSGSLGITARRQLVVLRTWGNPWLVGPDQTYVGLDARVSIAWTGFAVGGYVRLPTPETNLGVLLAGAITFGN